MAEQLWVAVDVDVSSFGVAAEIVHISLIKTKLSRSGWWGTLARVDALGHRRRLENSAGKRGETRVRFAQERGCG